MADKLNRRVIGVSLSVVILILYLEIQQANESLRRIELKIQRMMELDPCIRMSVQPEEKKGEEES